MKNKRFKPDDQTMNDIIHGIVEWQLGIMKEKLEISYRYRRQDKFKVWDRLEFRDCGEFIGLLLTGTKHFAAKLNELTNILALKDKENNGAGIVVPFPKNTKT